MPRTLAPSMKFSTIASAKLPIFAPFMTNANRFPRAVVSSILLAAALFLLNPSAFADMSFDRFGQWMGIAAEACNIAAESTLPVIAPIEEFLINPFNITEGVYSVINYTHPNLNLQTPSQTLESYLQRSSIQVRGDTITIDGIDYQDIWVTNDAAQAFRTNVLDLQTAFNIASNSNGKFVSGIGSLSGMPVFDVGGVPRTQSYSFAYPLTTDSHNYFKFSSEVFAGSGLQYSSSGGFYGGTFGFNLNSYPTSFATATQRIVPGQSDSVYFFSYWGAWRVSLLNSTTYILSYQEVPFDFSWVSQTIPAEQLDPDDGIHFLIPNNPDQFEDTTVKQNINNFNFNLRNNFEVNTPIDLSSDNNYTLFDSLFDVAFDLDIKPSFGPYNVYPPTPTPTPVPSPTPSSEPVPWPTLEPTPEPTVEPTPEPTSEPTPEPSSSPTPYPTPAPDVPMSDVHWGGFSDFVDNLESSFFSAVVDAIATPFESLWNVIKNVTGIWRYVVAWVGNISAPLNWSLSALGSAGSYFLSPFAAIAAAAVVIAVYRRIGK